MKLQHSILFIVSISIIALLLGCTGDEGPQGPAGPQGPEGEDVSVHSYLGDNANTCGHCHKETVDDWEGTDHSEAYADLVEAGSETNLYCVQCHTVGFDAVVAYGDTVVTTPGPNLDGFDDYWPPETAEDSARIEVLKNVQCESCHGPMGPTIYDHEPIISYATRFENGESLSLCVKCHGQVGEDGAEPTEWAASGHNVTGSEGITIDEWRSEYYATSSSCQGCHTSEGFISANDPDFFDWSPGEMNQIGCLTCHDPHSDTNEHQLRNLNDVTVAYTANLQGDEGTMSGRGTAQICIQCHHARRDNEEVEDQIENGNAHFGPHHSPQMDMYLGTGSYEIEGYAYDRTATHQTIEEACVTCHMTMRDHDDPAGWKGGHDFEPSDVACQSCHPGLEGFDYNGGQTHIDALLDELITLIGVDPEDLGNDSLTTVEQRMAGYAYAFVNDDGSHGVHNPTYAESLLENAIAFMADANAKNTDATVVEK